MSYENFLLLEVLLMVCLAVLSLWLALTKSTLRDLLIFSIGLFGVVLPKSYAVWSSGKVGLWAMASSIGGIFLMGFSLVRLSTLSIKRLEKAALHDPLTGAYNRRFIEKRTRFGG